MRGRRGKQLLVTLALALSMSAGAFRAEADTKAETSDSDRIGGYVFDALLLRPVGLVKTTIGAVVLVPAYPLSFFTSHTDSIVDRCVTDPGRDTFTRSLGDF